MNFANKISLFRILSVPFFIACLYYSSEYHYLRIAALVIFLVAVFSDAIDGYIARKSKLKSQAGVILDPLADKALLVSAFISLYLFKELPFWLILIVVTRDLLIIFGAVLIYMIKQKLNVAPTKWGKITTTFQMSAIIAVLLKLHISFVFWWLAAVFTIISGVDYLMRGFKVLYGTDTAGNSH